MLVVPLILAGASYAASLEIAEGEVHTIDAAITTLQLDRFVMGPGAVLRIPPGAGPVTIRARQAAFHPDSLIDARGPVGQTGRDGVGASGKAPECEDGTPGTPGAAGTAGGNGRDLLLTMGISRFDGLTIDASGGAGGGGGGGGTGSDGGAAKGCHAGDGGDGASGGNGGGGGNGGNIELRFWVTEPGVRVPVTNYGVGVTLRSEAGDAGAAGAGGKGGEGGRARYEKRSNGKTIAREAGDDGATGQPGRAGREGAAGRTLLEVIAPQAMSG